jgi:hypothetical protein
MRGKATSFIRRNCGYISFRHEKIDFNTLIQRTYNIRYIDTLYQIDRASAQDHFDRASMHSRKNIRIYCSKCFYQVCLGFCAKEVRI